MSIAHARPAQSVRHPRWMPVVHEHWRLITAELMLLLGTFVLAGIVKVHPGPLPGDLGITIAWQHLIRPYQLLTSALDFISTITWPMYVAIQMAVLVAVLALFRRWLDIAIALLTAGAADGSNYIISQLDQRPRPVGAGLYVHEHITGYFSFPSGHVEHVVAFLGIVVFLTFQVRRPQAWLWIVRAVLIAVVVLMGPARLLEGEHWPSDVLAGLLWGGFWLIIAIQIYHWAALRLPLLVPRNERKDSTHALMRSPGWEIARARTMTMAVAHVQRIGPGSQTRQPPVHVMSHGLLAVDLALLAGTLLLIGIVKAHPGPLPGDLGLALAWQHLVRPIPPVMSFLSFISLITWPTYVAGQVILIVAVLLLCRRWLDLVLALGVVSLSAGTNYLIMRLIDRPRPVGPGLYVQEHVTTYSSFPSGHVEYVIAFLGFALFLSFQVRRPRAWLWLLRLPLLTMILFIGPSRLVLGEHWPSDVLAGLLWGGFWLVLAIQVYPRAVARWPRLVRPNERKELPPGEGGTAGTRGHPVSMTATERKVMTAGLAARQGLSLDEVQARRLAGLGNTELPIAKRTYGQIVRHNLLTFINVSLLGLGLALLALGRPMDALSAVGLICFNAVVTAVQEIRAKRTLDRRVVLTPPTVTVMREGQERRVAPTELVAGDLVTVAPGDRTVVDGRIVEGRMVVDESLLSGKPEYTPKRDGDHLISGSVCVSGGGMYVAERVGAGSVIHRVASRARGTRRAPTPLQRQINFVFSVSLVAGIYIELLLVVRAVISTTNLADSVEQAAVIANLVPESLVLTIALAYAIGAIRVLRSGALAQEANAIESLSNLSVLCLDKTGTLTSNRFQIERMEPISLNKDELGRILADMAASATTNRVSEAIAASIQGQQRRVVSEIPFSPERRWGALAFDDPGDDGAPPLQGLYVIGAPEVVRPHLTPDSDRGAVSDPLIEDWTKQGLSVLQVAHLSGSCELLDLGIHSQLPDGLTEIGLVGLREELRPEARSALVSLRQAGIEVKILSGDDPAAAAAVAGQVGVDCHARPISGHELAAMDETALENAVESTAIFGGMTAEQKEKVVGLLRKRGHYVGMVGDGLNDVPALRRAQVGIAMQSGSEVARDAADLVLLNDSLSALPPVIAEGQRIVNSLQPAFKLFLTRITASALVILSSLTVAEVFPLRLRHGTILTILAVGLPTVLLALWAKPGPRGRGGPMQQQAHFVIPAALLSGMIGLLLFYGVLMLRVFPFISGHPSYTQAQLQSVLAKDLPTAQTELACFLVLTQLVLVIFVAPPTKWWAGGAEPCGDWRPAGMALGLIVGFGALIEVPFVRSLFGLAPLGVRHLAAVVGAAMLWLLAVRGIWRVQLGERLLRLERSPGAWYRNALRARANSDKSG